MVAYDEVQGAEEIILRDFEADDFDAISQLLSVVWHSDRPENARYWLGADELCGHLARTQRARVAVIRSVSSENSGTTSIEDATAIGAGERIVGACFTSANPNFRDVRWDERSDEIARAALEQDGVDSRADILYAQDEEALIAQTEKDFGTDGLGYVELLIVSSEARGKGIGAHIYKEGIAWLKEQGRTTIRLVTDDGCDWPFYEHLGMKRLSTMPSSTGEKFNCYIYEDTAEHLLSVL